LCLVQNAPVLGHFVGQVGAFVLEVAGSPHVSFGMRRRALDFISWLAQ
jgi:hypothetical protein